MGEGWERKGGAEGGCEWSIIEGKCRGEEGGNEMLGGVKGGGGIMC